MDLEDFTGLVDKSTRRFRENGFTGRLIVENIIRHGQVQHGRVYDRDCRVFHREPIEEPNIIAELQDMFREFQRRCRDKRDGRLEIVTEWFCGNVVDSSREITVNSI